MVTLSGYQEEAVQFLLEHIDGGLLADDVGLGKTFTSLVSVKRILDAWKTKTGPVWVVCPKTLKAQWSTAIEEVFYDWTREQLESTFKIKSYTEMVKAYGQELRPDIIVFDEAHMLKNIYAVRTQCALWFSRYSKVVWFLTATPAPNNPSELFTYLILPRVRENRSAYATLENLSRFLKRAYKDYLSYYFKIYEDPVIRRIIVKGFLDRDKQAEFVDIVSARCLRRTKENYLDLPMLSRKSIEIPWETADQEEQYYLLEKSMLQEAGRKKYSYLVRLREYSATTSKVNWLVPVLEERVQRGQSVIVFATFKSVLLDLVAKMSVPVSVITGDTPESSRVTAVKMFQHGDTKVLLATPFVGGVGLNLQVASVIYWIDLWWSPDVQLQGVGRAYRRGQTHDVEEYVLFHPDTIDEAIMKVLSRKRRFNAAIFREEVIHDLRQRRSTR